MYNHKAWMVLVCMWREAEGSNNGEGGYLTNLRIEEPPNNTQLFTGKDSKSV